MVAGIRFRVPSGDFECLVLSGALSNFDHKPKMRAPAYRSSLNSPDGGKLFELSRQWWCQRLAFFFFFCRRKMIFKKAESKKKKKKKRNSAEKQKIDIPDKCVISEVCQCVCFGWHSTSIQKKSQPLDLCFLSMAWKTAFN